MIVFTVVEIYKINPRKKVLQLQKDRQGIAFFLTKTNFKIWCLNFQLIAVAIESNREIFCKSKMFCYICASLRTDDWILHPFLADFIICWDCQELFITKLFNILQDVSCIQLNVLKHFTQWILEVSIILKSSYSYHANPANSGAIVSFVVLINQSSNAIRKNALRKY